MGADLCFDFFSLSSLFLNLRYMTVTKMTSRTKQKVSETSRARDAASPKEQKLRYVNHFNLATFFVKLTHARSCPEQICCPTPLLLWVHFGLVHWGQPAKKKKELEISLHMSQNLPINAVLSKYIAPEGRCTVPSNTGSRVTMASQVATSQLKEPRVMPLARVTLYWMVHPSSGAMY